MSEAMSEDELINEIDELWFVDFTGYSGESPPSKECREDIKQIIALIRRSDRQRLKVAIELLPVLEARDQQREIDCYPAIATDKAIDNILGDIK